MDEDFDFRASGITRSSFCSVYLDWIQFCYKKRTENHKTKRPEKQTEQRTAKSESQPQDLQFMHKENFDGLSGDARGVSPKSSNNQTPSPRTSKSEKKNEFKQQTQPDEIVSKLDCQIIVN